MTKPRVAILISGRGSNMRALVEAAAAPDYPAEIALVLSNRPAAPGLAWARERGLPTSLIDHTTNRTRETFDTAVNAALAAHSIDLVALTGFMRIMTPVLIDPWRDRMLSIHPSLLPAYRGLNTHARALADGVKIHGCTVHYVRHEVDTGPILAQAAVPVLPHDTEETLAARVLESEHKLYPATLARVAAGRPWTPPEGEAPPSLLVPPLSPVERPKAQAKR
jgi:phosphoribosylglycinamide formyltransferase-1